MHFCSHFHISFFCFVLFFMVVVVVNMINCNNINNIGIKTKFLYDFFGNKNGPVTFYNCWDSFSNKYLIQELGKNTKMHQISFYKKNNKFNDSFMKLWPSSSYMVIDFNCNSSQTFLNFLNDSDLIIYPIKYLLLVEKEDFEFVGEIVVNFQLLPGCEFIIAVFDGENVELHQPYKTGKFSELTWENYGNWSLNGKLFEFLSKIPTTQRRSNLKQVELTVVIVTYDNNTWNHLTDFRDPGIDTFTKQDYPAFACAAEFLNFNANMYAVDNYGYVNPETGEFSGLIHEIQSRKADVSGVSVYFTEDRYAVVDLIKLGNPLSIRFIVKKPSTSFVKNIFFITFTRDVWIAGIVIMIISGFVVKIILYWEYKHKQTIAGRKYTMSDITLITLEAVCQQGTTTEPQSFAGRIIAVILFGAFMFIYVSYSANIVVLLQSTTKINNIQELLDSRIKVGGCQTHYMKNYFESVKKGVLRSLYLKKIYPDQYYPFDVGMRMLQEGNFAFHVLLQGAYEYILNNFTNYEICALQQLPGYIEDNKGYIAIPKHSSYKDLFKVALLKVDEYGLQRRNNLRILEEPKCYSQVATFKSIELYDCEQVFWIWFYGVLVSLLIFIVEKLCKIGKKRYGNEIEHCLENNVKFLKRFALK